jgi:hypothetical protein
MQKAQQNVNANVKKWISNRQNHDRLMPPLNSSEELSSLEPDFAYNMRTTEAFSLNGSKCQASPLIVGFFVYKFFGHLLNCFF